MGRWFKPSLGSHLLHRDDLDVFGHEGVRACEQSTVDEGVGENERE